MAAAEPLLPLRLCFKAGGGEAEVSALGDHRREDFHDQGFANLPDFRFAHRLIEIGSGGSFLSGLD